MSGNRTEIFVFSLPSLFSVTPHPSVSFSLASSVLTPRNAAAALTGSPRERGEGGSRAQSRGYPPACEGRQHTTTFNVLNVRRFPPPSSRILRTSLHIRNPHSLMDGTETLCRDDIGDLPGSPNHL